MCENPNPKPQMNDSDEVYTLYPFWIENDCLYYQCYERYGYTYYKYTIEDGELKKFSQLNKRFFYYLIFLFWILFTFGMIISLFTEFKWQNLLWLVGFEILFYIYLSSKSEAKRKMQAIWKKYKNQITKK